jgi:YD repeat-containing protein
LQYNSHGQITSLVQPTTGGTKTTTFGYHPTTEDLNKITDSLNNDTVYVRDINGNIITATRYEGDVDTGTLKEEMDITVDQNGIPIVQSNDVTGRSSSRTVDENGAVDSQTSELGCTTSVSYTDVTSTIMPMKFSLVDPSVVDGSIFLPIIPAPRFPIMPYDPLPATSTNAKNQTTTYAYLDNGAPYTVTNYLNQTVSTYTYDDFGRTSTVTSAYGKTTTYQYDLNSRVTSIAREGQGTVSYVYDSVGNTLEITDPIKGTLTFTYNLRGDLLTNIDGSYTRDLLGRATAFSYTAGGSDSVAYTPEGYISSFNALSYTRNSLGQLTSWNNSMNGNGSASLSYTGTGSTALGLVGSMSGSGHVGSHLYQYDSKNWLSSFTDISKNSVPLFEYSYSTAKELTYLNYPENLQMHQIWHEKNITSQVYQNTQTQTTYASVSQSYVNDKLTGYSYNIKAGMTNFSDTVTPSYVSSGAMKEKLDTLTYSGSGRVITYGYDEGHGRLNSLKYSDIDPNTPFALNYDSAGRLTSIVDPNSQTISSYSYNANNQGLLSSITYTGNKSASFTWNAKKQITNYVYTDNSTQPATTKAWEMTYYDDGRMATHTYSLNNVYQYDWEYYYSPYGIEKALKKYYEQLLITIDATTAPNGRMLSMHYQDNTCQTNCFQGEASAAYDPCGNMISLVSHTTGVEVWARAVDKNSDATIGIYDPFNMEIPFSAQATIHPSYDQPINGPIEFRIPEQGQWELKEQLANLTKVNTTLGEMGVSASSSADDDCGDEMCGGEFASTCTKTECDKLFKNESSVEMNADYESSEYNCSFIFCCWGIYDFALHCTPTDKGLPLYDGPGKWVWAARSFIEDREANLWQWVATHYNDCIQYFPPPETPPDRKRI